MKNVLFLILLFAILSGCTGEEQGIISPRKCIDCHSIEIDTSHQLDCVSCHGGSSPADDKKNAHLGSLATPAHPDHFAATCGPCHKKIVEEIAESIHLSLSNSTNLFRKAFGAKDKITSFVETPISDAPVTKLQLADDLLRRRCFRCHLYNSGDNYPLVQHGVGCSACHMAFTEGKAQSHHFIRPGDEQCLSCHYGNYVGFDYYGRFEHDFNYEYRTPFTTKNKYFRPYGVEYHQLQPDVHQLRGMLCIDCHRGQELMAAGAAKPSCVGCHSQEKLERSLPDLVELQQDVYILKGRNKKEHPIPLMRHPAHWKQEEPLSCQVCHAQWTFNDIGKHLLRSDSDDFETWSNLSVQGDSEVETIVENNNDFDKDELPALMDDNLTGEIKKGIWYKGYTMRRWETIQLGRDSHGMITTMRPMLDYSLSWIDGEENVRFDSVQSDTTNKGLLPYVPHTTGPAGLFYKNRLQDFLASERKALPKTVPDRPSNKMNQ